MAKKNLVKDFQEYLEVEKGLSENSIFSYVSDVKKLNRFLAKEQIELQSSTQENIDEFLQKKTGRGKEQGRSIYCRLSGPLPPFNGHCS